MPSESTSLNAQMNGASQPAETTFRTAERQSKLRSYNFFLECAVVLTLYIQAVYWKIEKSTQAHILVIFGIVYFVRLNLMTMWLLKREIAMEELTFVILVWIPGILASYVFLAKEVASLQLAISVVVYLLGSFFNSWSEIQRKIWKQDPQNAGRCYTEGLFSWSRNINYFGDTLLFTGWALAAGNWWNSWAPILMGLLFYFHHIPDKEKYLAVRYADDWPRYLQSTPYSFVPFVC